MNTWNIGNLKIDGRVVLAPMSGYTSYAYRDFMKPFGVAVSVSEMVSDKGIIYDQERTFDYLRFPPNHPTGVQLFGNDPEGLAKGARRAMEINPDIAFLDVNMGCPVTKITRNGGGSALMKDPTRCGDIVRAMKREVDVPVTAKIRLGWSRAEMNYREVIEELTSAEVDCISVHVRTREERYAGNPNYNDIRGLRDEMSVPLIVSGNIYSLDDARLALETSGAEGVMVARGGVGNPFLVTQIDRYLRDGVVLPNPTVNQQIDWCLSFTDMLIREKGLQKATYQMRSYAPRFISGCRYSREYRLKLATETKDLDTLKKLLEDIRRARGDEVIQSSRGTTDSNPDEEF